MHEKLERNEVGSLWSSCKDKKICSARPAGDGQLRNMDVMPAAKTNCKTLHQDPKGGSLGQMGND